MKIHNHDAGLMTKIAAIQIYGKNTLKIFFPGTSRPILTKLCMKHWGLKPIIHVFCSRDNTGFALTYFMARSNFITQTFIWENVTIMDSL